jgi:hypothetical protein
MKIVTEGKRDNSAQWRVVPMESRSGGGAA